MIAYIMKRERKKPVIRTGSLKFPIIYKKLFSQFNNSENFSQISAGTAQILAILPCMACEFSSLSIYQNEILEFFLEYSDKFLCGFFSALIFFFFFWQFAHILFFIVFFFLTFTYLYLYWVIFTLLILVILIFLMPIPCNSLIFSWRFFDIMENCCSSFGNTGCLKWLLHTRTEWASKKLKVGTHPPRLSAQMKCYVKDSPFLNNVLQLEDGYFRFANDGYGI